MKTRAMVGDIEVVVYGYITPLVGSMIAIVKFPYSQQLIPMMASFIELELV